MVGLPPIFGDFESSTDFLNKIGHQRRYCAARRYLCCAAYSGRFQSMGGTASAKPHGMHLKMLVLGLTPLLGSDPTSMSLPAHLLQDGASVCWSGSLSIAP